MTLSHPRGRTRICFCPAFSVIRTLFPASYTIVTSVLAHENSELAASACIQMVGPWMPSSDNFSRMNSLSNLPLT